MAQKFQAALGNFQTIPIFFKTVSEKNILTRIPYKTNQAQKFSDLLENLEPAPRIFENSNVRAPAGTRVGGT